MYAMRLRTEYRGFVKFGLLSIVVLFLLYSMNMLPIVQSRTFKGRQADAPTSCVAHDSLHAMEVAKCKYRYHYPLTPPRDGYAGKSYRIAIIADLDKERSRVPNAKFTWRSFLRYGHLTMKDGRYTVKWEPHKHTLTSKLNEKGRGFELSELCVYNSRLYTVDDRTGIVYDIDQTIAFPWVILQDGDGMESKGFKGEWMTVKDGALYVGGLGKEWTTQEGKFINYHPLFVKSIDASGRVAHHNWTDNYLKIRAKAGIRFPGYMIHEAVSWSNVKRRWYFLPRRMSTLTYNDVEDERHGTNVLISCDADFNDIALVHVGTLEPTHGFSSFKFVPGTGDDVAVALKSREVSGEISSFVMVFNVETGHVLMPETQIDTEKFEGIEFV